MYLILSVLFFHWGDLATVIYLCTQYKGVFVGPVWLCNRLDCSPPGSSVIECSRQEYWSGLPFPSPGDRPDPGIGPTSPTLEVDSLPPESPGKYERGVLIIQQSDIWRTRTETNWKGAKQQQKFSSTPGVYTSTLKVRIWKIPCKSQCIERLLLYQKIPGFLAPSREEFNLGPVMRLDRSGLLWIKFY